MRGAKLSHRVGARVLGIPGSPGKTHPVGEPGNLWSSDREPMSPVGHISPTTACLHPTATHSSELDSALSASYPARTNRYAASDRRRDIPGLASNWSVHRSEIGKIQSRFARQLKVKVAVRSAVVFGQLVIAELSTESQRMGSDHSREVVHDLIRGFGHSKSSAGCPE